MKCDVMIIGGGIVGLATAYRLLQHVPDCNLILVEKEKRLAAHQTGNNSGVIHSGIYYKPGSLKALNCKKGYEMLLDFCSQQNIPFELCGKIIVAGKEDELERLNDLYERGVQNGLEGLKKISADEIREIEPHVKGLAGIYVPQTGIIDYTAVCEKLASCIRSYQQASINLGEKVTDIRPGKSKTYVVTTRREYKVCLVINCGGLHSDRLAKMSMDTLDMKIIPIRGEYYNVKEEKHYLVKNLVYPVPDPAFPFLGVHFTRMINGGVEAGPNAVLAFRREGYKKNSFSLKESLEILFYPGFQKVMKRYWKMGFQEFRRSYSRKKFAESLQALVPEITRHDIVPGGAGVRAQACERKGGLVDDFIIYESPGVINVCNAPSPAATASLAIGESIAQKALGQLSRKKDCE